MPNERPSSSTYTNTTYYNPSAFDTSRLTSISEESSVLIQDPSFTTRQLTTRNSRLFNLSDYHIVIIGCGAIGSFTADILARSGVLYMDLFDGDMVSSENIGVQNYFIPEIGQYKTMALKGRLLNINPAILIRSVQVYVSYTNSDQINEIYNNNQQSPIFVIGVDSMDARLDIVKAILSKQDYFSSILIDPRMGSETFQMYTFNQGWTIEDYMKTWYKDEDGDNERCNARSTSYCANMSGSFISNQIRKIISKQTYSTDILFNFPAEMLVSSEIKG